MHKLAAAVVAMVSALGLMTSGALAQGVPLKIRMGWAQLPGHLAPILFQNKAVLKHYGKSYVVEPIRFRGTTPQIQALAAGELEMATLAPSGLVFAVRNAKLEARVIGDTFHDNGKTHWTSPFLVRTDSGINKIEDLKGKRVASNAIGSASDSAMRTMLKRHGLTDKDYNTIETAFGTMPAMLMEKKVDLIVALPQFIKMVDPAKTKALFTLRDAVGAQQTIMWVMRADVIAKNRAALVDYWEDHIRALRWFIDPNNREEAIKYVMAFTKQSRDSLDYAFTENDYFRSPDARPSIEGILRGIDHAVEGGLIDSPLDKLEPYLDLSLIEEAKQRIDGKKASSSR
ncbi:MAG: ABC transporter substrate-binding protein [Hyphomicrobiales bacterium]|nr:ABC transporter substrate-binding protein [Hyphomicrobiales bacterium]